MVTSTERSGGHRAVAARTNSWTGLPSVHHPGGTGRRRGGPGCGPRGWWPWRPARGRPPLGPRSSRRRSGARRTRSRCGRRPRRSAGRAGPAHRPPPPPGHGRRRSECVVVDPVALGRRARPTSSSISVRGGLAVGAGGAQQLHPLGPGPGPFELGQQRRQHGGVGHRPGEVGEDHGDRARRVRSGRRARGPAIGSAQRLAHRTRLVGQGRAAPGARPPRRRRAPRRPARRRRRPGSPARRSSGAGRRPRPGPGRPPPRPPGRPARAGRRNRPTTSGSGTSRASTGSIRLEVEAGVHRRRRPAGRRRPRPPGPSGGESPGGR